MTRAPSGPLAQNTLRAELDERRAKGTAHTLKEAVGLIVPLAVELAQRHGAGERLFLHPSSVVIDDTGTAHVSSALARRAPTSPKDLACVAPEERDGQPGDARSSVFAIGAMLYELCTGLVVGPGMRRPSEVVGTLPSDLDQILAKALVGDAAHR